MKKHRIPAKAARLLLERILTDDCDCPSCGSSFPSNYYDYCPFCGRESEPDVSYDWSSRPLKVVSVRHKQGGVLDVVLSRENFESLMVNPFMCPLVIEEVKANVLKELKQFINQPITKEVIEHMKAVGERVVKSELERINAERM